MEMPLDGSLNTAGLYARSLIELGQARDDLNVRWVFRRESGTDPEACVQGALGAKGPECRGPHPARSTGTCSPDLKCQV